VNTGWTGGPFGVGKRISIRHTRALLDAALSGELQQVACRTDAVFGFDVPLSCGDVPPDILDPAQTWPSRAEYESKYDALAARFIENFKLFAEGCPREVVASGPVRAGRVTAR
jgi:phosphoenolpyruvate carboxykinase (ATP)